MDQWDLPENQEHRKSSKVDARLLVAEEIDENLSCLFSKTVLYSWVLSPDGCAAIPKS